MSTDTLLSWAPDLSAPPPGFASSAVGLSTIFLLAASVAGCLVVLWRDLRARRLEQAEETIWRRLAPYLSGREGLVMASVELLDEFPERAVARALRRCRREFGGEALDGAAVALAMIGETSRLRRGIESRVRRRRLAAAHCLGDCGGPRAIEGLLTLLAHRCRETRRAARLALLQCGGETSLRRALGSYVADEPSPRRIESVFIRELVRKAPALVVDELKGCALPAPHRRLILDALAEIGWRGGADVLDDQLQSSDPEVRAAAARLTSRLRDWRQRRRLIELLRDDTWYVRAAAASALGRLPSQDAVAPLSSMLSDRRSWVRRSAATGLVRHGEAGIGALVRALGQPGSAAEAARRALFEVGLGPEGSHAKEAS
ncbi:MAG: HEAT repeat domain-containing protein [Acidobacteriota bacterium]